MSFSITSPAFDMNQKIPERYTCDGEDISPPLHWSDQPLQTQSLALIMDDPDAPDPDAPQMTWVHWVLYNLPSDSCQLPQAVMDNELPPGTLQGINSWNHPGYGGPCPPKGRHRYFFKLYALDFRLPDLNSPDADRLSKHMSGHILLETQLMGTFQR